MTRPEPMNHISASAAWVKVMNETKTSTVLPLYEFAKAIESARDAQWEQMLGEPVAYAQPNGFEYVSMHHDKYHTIPLYALGDDK